MLVDYKVIMTKPGLRWVRWSYRDATYYGFEDEDKNMLEVFQPTPSLRGNALRAHVQKLFETKERCHYRDRWPSAAMDADEVLPGMVLVYEVGRGEVEFSLIVEMTQSLFRGISNRGRRTLWLYERLTSKLQTREVQCIELDTVPEEFRTFNLREPQALAVPR